MLLLTSTSDKLQVVSSAAVTTDVQASWVDYAGGAITPGRTNSAITTATTTDVVAAPAASTQRNVKHLSVRNRHASSSQDVTVKHTDGTTAVELFKCTLLAGEHLVFSDGAGFMVFTSAGALKTADQGLVSVAYTPVWTSDGTQPAIGNGTILGRYVLVGDIPIFKVELTAGSTTTFGTGSYYLSLPFPAAAERWSLTGDLLDTGIQHYGITGDIDGNSFSNTTHEILAMSNTVGPTNWGATNPFTFGSGDKIVVTGTYRKT